MLKVLAPALLCVVFSASAFAYQPDASLIGGNVADIEKKLTSMGYVENEASEKDAPIFVLHTSDMNPNMQDTVTLKTNGDKKVSEVFFTSITPMPYNECVKTKAESNIKMSCQENNVANIYRKF